MRILFFFASLLLVALGHTPTHAQALVVAPTRVIIEAKQKNTEVGVTNLTGRPVRYRITLEDMAMNERGIISPTVDFPYSAKNFVRFMPKVISLQPNQRQTIRLLATRPSGQPAGDYHSHLMFNEIFAPTPTSQTASVSASVSSSAPTESPTAGGVGMVVEMSFSTGVPVIVQTGAISSSLGLVNAALLRNAAGQPYALQLQLRRTGNAEGAALLRGKVNDPNGTEAFPDKMLRVYRERETVTMVQTIPSATIPFIEKNGLTFSLLSPIDRKTPLTTQTLK